ncbi:MAG: AgmX/PglI C-terminal domain-containing protein [Bacteriovoracales bacterium]
MYTGKERRQAFELNPTDKSRSAKLIDKRRTIIGKAETCDIILDFSDITPVHAILEITKEGNKIYDLNSKTGTYVNNVKVLIGEFKEGDKLKFGSHEFIYKKFEKEEAPPPFLQMLDPTLPEKFTPKEIAPPPTPVMPKIEGIKIPPKPAYIPKVAYPLNEDPKAATSPFILEESDTLYPIFDYEPGKSSIEVMVHYKENLISLDYIPLKNGKYPLVGRAKRMRDLELPILAKKERIEFLNVSGGSVRITTPIGFEPLFLMDKKSEGPIHLTEDDLVRYYKNNVQILVRLAPKPPYVKRAPLLSKDKELLKVLALVYLLMLAFLFFIALTKVDVEKEKEKDLEKAPERIAKVLLHKPKPIIEEPKVAEVPVTPIQGTAPVTEIKKVEVVKETPKPAPPKPPKKAEPVHGKVEAKKSIVTTKPSTKKGPPAPPKVKGPKAPPGKIVAKKQPGPVTTFSLGFKPNISSTLAKGEKVEAAGSSTGVSESEMGVSGGVGAGGATTVKKGGFATGVGSLTGVAKGSLDSAEGVAGLSNKDSVYSVGMPGKTVVLGSMDPDVIRKILRDNVPLFSNCYQKELEGTGDISGTVKLNFVIGSSGSVSKASTTTDANIPGAVIGCVTKVLRGIQFPPPMGGGSVEVVQPLNLQPKRI